MKPWYRSKTFWFNVVTLIVAIATLAADPSLVKDMNVVAGAAGVVTVGNIILRMLTDTAIEGTPAARRKQPPREELTQ